MGKTVRLTARDRAIFRTIFRQRVASASQIARLHFQVPRGCRHDDGQDQQEPAPGLSRPTARESDCREYKVRTRHRSIAHRILRNQGK